MSSLVAALLTDNGFAQLIWLLFPCTALHPREAFAKAHSSISLAFSMACLRVSISHCPILIPREVPLSHTSCGIRREPGILVAMVLCQDSTPSMQHVTGRYAVAKRRQFGTNFIDDAAYPAMCDSYSISINYNLLDLFSLEDSKALKAFLKSSFRSSRSSKPMDSRTDKGKSVVCDQYRFI